MAGRARPGVNGANGHGGRPGVTSNAMLSRADSVAESAAAIAHLADEAAAGAETQMQTIDQTVGELNEMMGSLADSARRAESVTSSAEGLASSLAEMAASV